VSHQDRLIELASGLLNPHRVDDRLFGDVGRCREFMRQVDPENLRATVILGRAESAELAELLPRHDWPEPLA
jgi:hypothetical protein